MNQLDEKLNVIKTKENISAVSNDFEKYRNDLIEHLEAEECLSLPLLRAYFSQADFKTIGKRMGKEDGHSGSFVYFCGEDKFRNELMVKWGMPSFVSYEAFSKALQEYQVGVIRHVEAIETNKKPPPQDDSNCSIQ